MKSNKKIKTNSAQAWILAARPKTLAGAAIPVTIGMAWAMKDSHWHCFQFLPPLLCLLFAFLMQIDSNFINDYFDFVKGNDDPSSRIGPKRACAEGWITPQAMRQALIIVSILACIVGLPLIYYGGWEMTIVGATCLLFAFLYTTFFSYHGMGDVLVIIFFGIIPVCFTYYVTMPINTHTITTSVFFCSIGCGCVIDTLLCVNNFRDRINDKKDKKKTLIVKLGEKKGAQLYNIAGLFGACVTWLSISICNTGIIVAALCLIPFLFYIYYHSRAYQKMKKIWEGRELNKVLGMTARNMLVYGLMAIIAIGISAF